MKTSIVMTTYNGAKYLKEQLDSLRLQSAQVDEVIIFDDKSNDEQTTELINKYILDYKLDCWKLIINEKNLGWKKNFINAINFSSGDLIFLCDQDDIWELNKVEVMKNTIVSNPEISLLTTNYKTLNLRNEKLLRNKALKIKNNAKLEKVKLTPIFYLVGRPGCTYCFTKEFRDEYINYWTADYPHDELLWISAIFTGKLYRINLPLITFRRHGNNATGYHGNLSLEYRLSQVIKELEFITKISEKIFSAEIKKNKNLLKKYIKWLNFKKDNFTRRRIFKSIIGGIFYYKFYPSFKSYMADILSIMR